MGKRCAGPTSEALGKLRSVIVCRELSGNQAVICGLFLFDAPAFLST